MITKKDLDNGKLLKDGGEDYIIKNTTDLLIDVFQSNDYNIKTMEDIYFNNNCFKKLIDVYNSNGKIENNIIKEKLQDLNIRIAMRDFSEKTRLLKREKYNDKQRRC